MWPFSRKREASYTFSEEDRSLSKQIRMDRAEIAKKKAELDLANARLEHEKRKAELEADIAEARQRLADITDDDEDDGDDSDDLDLNGLLASLFAGQAQAAHPPPPATPQGTNLTDEQLREIAAKIPATYRTMAKTMSDETLAQLIRARMPGLSEETVSRAVSICRE